MYEYVHVDKKVVLHNKTKVKLLSLGWIKRANTKLQKQDINQKSDFLQIYIDSCFPARGQ